MRHNTTLSVDKCQTRNSLKLSRLSFIFCRLFFSVRVTSILDVIDIHFTRYLALSFSVIHFCVSSSSTSSSFSPFCIFFNAIRNRMLCDSVCRTLKSNRIELANQSSIEKSQRHRKQRQNVRQANDVKMNAFAADANIMVGELRKYTLL